MMRFARYVSALVQDLAAAARLGGDARSRYTLACDFLAHRLMKLMAGRGPGAERSVRLRDGTLLHYRRNRSDIWTIHEVWVQEMYRLPVADRCPLIVDLGANIGLASVWLARRYGGRRVVAVEPSPTNAALARKNLQSNSIAATVIEAAIGPRDGVAVFDPGPGATNGRIVAAEGQGGGRHAVSMVTMDSADLGLAPGEEIDLVKMDIEGGEGELLSANTSWLGRVRSLVAEFHHSLIDYGRVGAALREAGLRRVGPSAAVPESGNSLEFFVRGASGAAPRP
jgi:FkbM family methyltransferase